MRTIYITIFLWIAFSKPWFQFYNKNGTYLSFLGRNHYLWKSFHEEGNSIRRQNIQLFNVQTFESSKIKYNG